MAAPRDPNKGLLLPSLPPSLPFSLAFLSPFHSPCFSFCMHLCSFSLALHLPTINPPLFSFPLFFLSYFPWPSLLDSAHLPILPSPSPCSLHLLDLSVSLTISLFDIPPLSFSLLVSPLCPPCLCSFCPSLSPPYLTPFLSVPCSVPSCSPLSPSLLLLLPTLCPCHSSVVQHANLILGQTLFHSDLPAVPDLYHLV